MRLKFIRRDRGSFSGGLLPFLPVCCRDRAERVLAVRVMSAYVKSVLFPSGTVVQLKDKMS